MFYMYYGKVIGGLFKEEGQLQTAANYFKEAIRLCPEFADAHSNLGNVLKDQVSLLSCILR